MTEFASLKQIYLVGIKGVAMTALAQCFVDMGIQVEGSDVAEAFVTQPILDTLGIHVKEGFHESNIRDQVELVVYTGAHKGSANPEVLEAKRRNIPTLSHAQALGELMATKQGISVCGVGGKSTTSAMIAWILEKTGNNPSYAVGVGGIPGLRSPGKYSNASKLFVAEADEYATDPGTDNTPRFIHQHPKIIVCTNIQFDHPDIYKTFEDTQAAYLKFFMQLPTDGTLIVNGDDEGVQEVLRQLATSGKKLTVAKVGTGNNAMIQLGAFTSTMGETSQVFTVAGKTYTVKLMVPGQFNARNAVYAICAAHMSGVSMEDAIDAVATFNSTKRRFENIGVKDGIQFYDDYAHHPSEIQATLKALREWYPGKYVVALFQSHTYSRTKELLTEFAQSFKDADEVVLTDIFPSARESADPTITSDILAEKILAQGVKAQNLHTNQASVEYLKSRQKKPDVVITIGAGDVYHLHELW